MTLNNFIKKYNGHAVDYDGIAGVQCVDLADQYLKDVFNITGIWVSGARDFYNNYANYPALVKYFKRIKNTRELIVQAGDLVVWGGGSWGHIAIGTGEGDIDYFASFEQNTRGRHEAAHIVTHKFNSRIGVDACYPVLGVLRAREQYQYLITGYKRKYRVILAEGLNIRSAPNMLNKYKTGEELKRGDIFEVIQIENETPARSWGRLADGRGWVCLTKFTAKLIE